MKKNDYKVYFGELGSQEEIEGDKDFWKDLTTEERFTAAWDIVVNYYTLKGRADELRFRRSIETAGEI